MINQIISNTPTWVFALFFGLIYLGVQQSRTRTLTAKRMIVLPIAMLGLSLSGVWNTFHASNLSLLCWSVAVCIGALTTISLVNVKQSRYHADTQTFELPGSWLPLTLMMALFFTKYAVGASIAYNPALVELNGFVTSASIFYGLCSGVFVGRAMKVVGTHGKALFA